MNEDGSEFNVNTPQHGVVVDRKDPEGLHRIRARIPGRMEKTAWAWPITAGGGSPQRGGHVVPALGADVVVWFLNGDRERPIYQAAHWGKPKAGSEMPTGAKDTPTPEDVQVLQLGEFLITIDERPRDEQAGTGQLVSIESTVTGDGLTFDLKKQGLRLKATSLLQLQADGLVEIKGLGITLNGRKVLTTGRHI